MKKITFVCFIIICLFQFVIHVNAQSVHWVKQGSSQGFDNGNAIVADDSGNVYVTGQIEYTAVFDSYSIASHGIHDILTAKYSTNGNIKWIHGAGGHGGDVGNAIGIDAAHNTYVAGEVEDTAIFSSNISLTSSGSNDIFLAKYDAGGNILWAKRWGSGSNDKALAIAVAANGDCFITGYFSSSTNFGGTTLSSSGGNDIFILKTNSSGVVQWAKKAGGSNEDRGRGIALDKNGNIYVTGSFTQSAYFNFTSVSNSGKNSAFLAKYNSSGQFQWVRASGACCDTTSSNAVAIDENNNVYFAGYFRDVANFGSNHFNSLGLTDAVIIKYDPSGNVGWAKRAGGVDDDVANGITADTINHVLYVTGSIHAVANFDTCSVPFAGYKDIFLAAYNMSGNAIWAKSYGGGYRDEGSAIAVDRNGYIYTTGLFNGTAHFDSFTLNGYPNQPWADFYVDKISALPVSAPSTSSSNLNVNHGNCSDLDISFTSGNGSRRVVIVHQGSAVTSAPVDGHMYTASTQYGNGSDLGSGDYVVYNGSGNNVTLTGLTPGADYYFSVVEYNGTGANINYRSSNALTGSGTAANFTINLTGLQNAVCAGQSLSLVASGASTYTWSPAADLSSGSGASVTATPSATTTFTINAVTSQGCHALRNFTIAVNPLPSAHFPNLNDVCVNDPSFTLNTGTPIGGTYSGVGVSNGQFTPSVAGIGTFTLVYLYIDSNGCSDANPGSINVLATPIVTIATQNNVCVNNSPVTLNGGTPNGGSYSGTGVSNGIFDPSIGAGTYSITYSYTNSQGCSAFASTPQVVNSNPAINLGNDITVCAYNSIALNPGGNYSSYNWSTGETTSSITVDSNGIGLNSTNIFLQVSNAANCTNSDTMMIAFDLCASVDNPSLISSDISVFPNPFQKEFNIISNEEISFSIFDVCGRLLEDKKDVRGNITDGAFLANGVYTVEVFMKHSRKVFSIIKE